MLANRWRGLYDISDCRAPYPAKMAQDGHRESCLICRIFGAPALPSSLRWHSVTLANDWREALKPSKEEEDGIYGQTYTRTQVQLSRKRGVAAEARLFSSEFAAENMVFDASPALTGHLELTPMTVTDENNVYHEIVLLLAGFRMIRSLGGGRSRGSGQCEINLPENIFINRRAINVTLQLENIEGLVLYGDDRKALA